MASLLPIALEGFILGLSLIIAIGAQNAYVLKLGLQRQHVTPVVLACIVIDAALISLGIVGLGALVEVLPWLTTALTYLGAAFLLAYAALSLRAALRPQSLTAATEAPPLSRRRALLTVLGFSLLNPHVYLDTVVLLGGLGARYEGVSRAAFGIGAVSGSTLWFAALGYGAAYLAPVFAKPLAWRTLDLLIAVVMLGLALLLLQSVV